MYYKPNAAASLFVYRPYMVTFSFQYWAIGLNGAHGGIVPQSIRFVPERGSAPVSNPPFC